MGAFGEQAKRKFAEIAAEQEKLVEKAGEIIAVEALTATQEIIID